jgi:universal stress protein E
MSRIAHILVVVDPSPAGRQSAVFKATQLARCMGASMEMLICDAPAAPAQNLVAVHASTTPGSDAGLLDLLEACAAPARAQGLDVTCRLIHGKSLHDPLLDFIRASNADLVVKDTLSRSLAARASNADLVVKDTRPRSLAARTLERNTDWHLARACPVPLLLTKNRAWSQPPSVMAAVDPDHSNEWAAALDRHILYCAASLAGCFRGDLHVIHTFIPAAFARLVAIGETNVTGEYAQTLQLENSYKYSRIERLTSAYGVTRDRLHLEMGTPGDCSLRAVQQHRIDVMAMGASSRGRWHRVGAGSTASTLLESLPCDVLIVNPCDQTQAVPF